MRRFMLWLGAFGVGLLSVGCASVDFPGQPTYGELARDLSPDEVARSEYVRPTDKPTVRLQRGDDIIVAQGPSLAPPQAVVAPVSPPPPAAATKKSLTPPPPVIPAPAIRPIEVVPPPSSDTELISFKQDRSSKVKVRAWVNGRPIFNDEIMLEIEMTAGGAFYSAPNDIRDKIYSDTLMRIIDLEIAYQDAVRKLEKVGGRTLDRLKESVEKEYQKNVRGIRKNVPEDKFVEIEPTYRRQFERQFIGMEYARSRVFVVLDQIGYLQIKEYYDTHLNEFQKVDSLKWQHVFLAVRKDRPTVADCRAFGESLLARVAAASPDKQEEAFKALAEFDDGDSKTRGGMGFGNRKGEIQPAVLESQLLTLKNGQIGPIHEIPGTGVHLYRLIEREAGGQVPLNETVQNQIRNKIRNQIFEREFKRFTRELKARAVWEIEKN
jgi:parvulin-like peptidyl-prolyl isomerase